MLTHARTALDRSLQWIVISLMVLLTVIVVVAVAYRKMGASLSWYDEVASVVLAWLTYYGAALAALYRAHLGFDSVLLSLPRPARLTCVVIGEVFVIGFFLLLAYAGWKVLLAVQGENLISLPWIPVWLTQSVIPIGAALFIVGELLSLPEYWRNVSAGRSLEHVALEKLEFVTPQGKN